MLRLTTQAQQACDLRSMMLQRNSKTKSRGSKLMSLPGKKETTPGVMGKWWNELPCFPATLGEKKTNLAPGRRPSRKSNSSSNHPFSGVNSLLVCWEVPCFLGWKSQVPFLPDGVFWKLRGIFLRSKISKSLVVTPGYTHQPSIKMMGMGRWMTRWSLLNDDPGSWINKMITINGNWPVEQTYQAQKFEENIDLTCISVAKQ